MVERSGPMACPVDGTALVMSERQNIEIDYCPTCRGVWLDRGELDKIIERSLSENPAVPHAPVAPPPPYPPQAPQGGPWGQPGYQQGHNQGYGHSSDYGHGHGHKKRRKSWLDEIFD